MQGVTEFLPVSSSGHLILARAFFGWDPDRFGLAFDVACHVGTLLAVVVYFWRDLLAMLRATPAALRPSDWLKVVPSGVEGRLRSGQAQATQADEYPQLVRLVIVGTIPIVIVGLLYADRLEGIRSPAVVAVTLAIGAIGLLVADRLGPGHRPGTTLSYGHALLIGIAQAAALVPGVSRSGATLTVALLIGLARPAAARFVFLLSMPAVLAAAMKEGLELSKGGSSSIPVTLFAVGLIVSAVVGYLTVAFFIRYLARHSLTVFAVYRFALAGVTALWLLGR